MLREIELWNFEAHDHTLIENLSEGLNVIFGPSNAGKTSIVRALRLVAYNEFEPESLRVGCKNCKVRVKTDKGVVQVTRGPSDNLWEITPNGGNTVYMDKIGRVGAPQQAAEILGLSMVKLGDVDIPVNIMDQLETHFMLAGIGDEKATGSVRAQIIDEISGLSGVEGIIKDVSLDIHRAGREIKLSEQQMEELKPRLHDEAALKTEAQILTEAEKHLTDYQDALQAVEEAEALLTKETALDVQMDGLRRKLAVIPDTKLAEGHIDNSREAWDVAISANDMQRNIVSVDGEIARLGKAIAVVPDHAKAASHLDRAQKSIDRASAAKAILDAMTGVQEDISSKEKRLRRVVETAKVSEHFKAAEKAIEDRRDAEDMVRLWESNAEDIGELEGRIAASQKVLAGVLAEQDDLLRSIKVCPLNPAHPVSEDCLKGLRKPVTEVK